MNIWENRYDVKSGFIENSGFKAPASWDNDNPVSSFRPKWRNLFRLRLIMTVRGREMGNTVL